MDPKYCVSDIPGYEGCIISTRTTSQERGQLKMEYQGKKYQMLAVHAVALHQGKKPQRWYDELSHIDGCPRCLVCTQWELPWDNISRDGCHKYSHFKECPHLPPCKKTPPHDVVKAAITQKRKMETEKREADPKKKRKHQQNAKAYAAKKQRQTIKNND